METLYCACCGRPFRRTSPRGPAPLYCSRDCRRQIEVRRRVWAAMGGAPAKPPVHAAALDPAQAAWGLERQRNGQRNGQLNGRTASA